VDTALLQVKTHFLQQVHCVACPQVNAASCVVGKLDYSTACLCLAHSVPYIYVKQGTSSDEPFICSLLDRYGLGIEMTLKDYESGYWDLPYMEQIELMDQKPKPTYRYTCMATSPAQTHLLVHRHDRLAQTKPIYRYTDMSTFLTQTYLHMGTQHHSQTVCVVSGCIHHSTTCS